jgi:2-iminobutanoate/2-iminopropanoate deaminase
MINKGNPIRQKNEENMAEVKRITTPFSYSSAVAAGDFVFLGLHRGFGNTMSRLKTTLAEFDMKLEHLVKVNVWLKDIQNVRIYENLFRNYFEEGKYPARIGTTTEFIDDDCLLMIDGIAYRC